MIHFRSKSLIFCALLGAVSVGEAADPVFNQDIRPILSDHCFQCHGPDATKRKAGLRLDVAEGAYAEVDPGVWAIRPGQPEESEVIRRIYSTDPDEMMPPPETKLPLNDQDRETIRNWIQSGAEYQSHWAFIPVERPEIPTISPKDLPDGVEIKNPVDALVFHKLQQRGWGPQPSATKEKLIRRVTLDLTGLPPTPEEVQAFVNDENPDAYEKWVDQLLERETYGERMAVDWLDLARYADSYGYQVDRERDVWAYRDWVINAFNKNLPFDDFIRWQLAGDLLPDPTREQILATAFNRLHPQKSEGGSIPEEFRTEYVADRVRTFGTAFLGLTLECSRCHDHKYDPIAQKEYYQLFAYFNNIDEAGLYAFFGSSIPTPTLRLTHDDQDQKIADAKSRIRELEQQWAALKEAVTSEDNTADDDDQEERTAFLNWLKSPERGQLASQSIPGEIAHFAFDEMADGNKVANLASPDHPASIAGSNQLSEGYRGQAVELTGDDPVNLNQGNFTRNDPFSIGLWMWTPDLKERAVVLHRSRAWTDSASRGYQLLLEEGKLSMSLIHFWPGNAMRVKTIDPFPIRNWTHVTVTYDGSSRAAGLQIYINGELAEVEVVRDKLTKNITGTGGDNIALGERFRDRGFAGGKIDELRVFERELSPLEATSLWNDLEYRDLLSRSLDCLEPEHLNRLSELYLLRENQKAAGLLAELKAARQSRSQAEDGVRELMVMGELSPENRRISHILNRGAYDAPGEIVEPATPEFLPAPGSRGKTSDRLDLANWLVTRQHPLTSRVTVNRFWQALFGIGLVETAEDFGSQGDAPIYPEALDWLSAEFMESGWDVKAIMKTIVMSHTYQQRSIADAEIMREDPKNRWLARGPRYRMNAEMIRDNALAVAGLLVQQVGGAPVKPYEVEVSFKPMGADQGDGLYRRSIYTFWKRTGPAPVMMSFDAVKRDVCVARRERTSSPLQALALMNGTQFVEAARALGQDLIQNHPDCLESRIREAFWKTTSRAPSEKEIKICEQLFAEQKEYYTAHPEDAKAYNNIGKLPVPAEEDAAEIAAMTTLSAALLSHDECIVKR